MRSHVVVCLAATNAYHPKGRIHLAERLTRGSDVQYEVHLKSAPKKEMALTPEGKIVKEE